MNKKAIYLIALLAAIASCSNKPIDNKPITDVDPFPNEQEKIDDESAGGEIDITVDGNKDNEVIDSIITDITDLSVPGISYDTDNKLFTITAGGEYIFTGSFNGNIIVNAGDTDDVKLTFNGFTIAFSSDSPIKCLNANGLQVSLKKGTKNYIYDNREHLTSEDDTQGKGAIYSECDLKISGKGSLELVANYYNGIHSKDDVTIKPEVNDNSSVQIKAYNNCIKGNDSVEINSGNIVLISTGGNGIVTENTDISSKGNQRGNIVINGGHVDIYSAKDAIDAAYNAEISSTEAGVPIINIYTNKYSTYTSDISVTSTEDMYIKVSNSNVSNGYYYAVEFLKSDYTTSWVKGTEVNTSSRNNKYYKVERPIDANSFKLAYFSSSISTMSEESATAISRDFSSINQYYDTVSISRSGSTISIGNWSNFSSGQGGGFGGPGGGMQEGNDDKAEVSAKGIKAANKIIISDGKFFIKTYEDAIHANHSDAFENGETGIGDVVISGGTFDIYSSDDGIHADHQLDIYDGTIDIKNSYEGLEANLINILGGYTKIYATDDGLNGSNKSGLTPVINVSGGIVDVTVYGQDVDGIDSNGSFTQSGGIVITKGGNSQMSTGLDCDRGASMSGGTFIAFGRIETTLNISNGVNSYSISGSYNVGTHIITFDDTRTLEVATKFSYSIIYVYSSFYSSLTVK